MYTHSLKIWIYVKNVVVNRINNNVFIYLFLNTGNINIIFIVPSQLTFKQRQLYVITN